VGSLSSLLGLLPLLVFDPSSPLRLVREKKTSSAAMQFWSLPIVLLAVVAAAISAPVDMDSEWSQEEEAVTNKLDVSTTRFPSLATLPTVSTRKPSISTTSRKPLPTLPSISTSRKPRRMPTRKPVSVRPDTIEPFTREPFTREPFTRDTRKPVNVETLKPFSPSATTFKPVFRTTQAMTPTIRKGRATSTMSLDGPGWQLMDTPSTFDVNDAMMSKDDEPSLSTIDDDAAFGTTLSGPGWQTMTMESDATDMTDLPEDEDITTALPDADEDTTTDDDSM
jgi:hypothetical protein